MTKVLMVCLGNICRSPLAEAILRYKADPSKIEVDSAGTGSYHIGKQPCDNSIKIAKENLLDITNLIARKFEVADFDNFDVIFAMDTHNLETITAMAPDEKAKKKVKLLLDEVFPGEKMNVPDPYTSSYFAFKNIFLMLDEACEQVIVNYT